MSESTTPVARSTRMPRILRQDEAQTSEVSSFLATAGPGAAPITVAGRIDAARRTGYEEGYQAALEEVAAGEAAGRAAQLRRVADALVAAADAVTASRVEAVQVASAEAAELAVELAEALIQYEIEGGNHLADALRRALALAPAEEAVMELRINPADAIAEDEIRGLAPGIALSIVGDPGVEVGGCILTAGPCRIDAQIGPAVARARQVIADLLAPGDDEPEETGRALGSGDAAVFAMGRVA